MYLCFHWLQLSRRSMGVINTLQQLTFNILPQPLTPLMADWLCEAWEPHSWEWHGSILSVKEKADRSLQNLWLQLILYWYEVTSTRDKDQGILEFLLFAVCLFQSCYHYYLSSRFLSLPTWLLEHCVLLAFHPHIFNHSKTPSLPPLII